MQIRFFGLTRDAVCSLVYDNAISNKLKIPFNKEKKKAEPDWLQSFFRRHPELSLRQPESTSLAQATGFNKVQVNNWIQCSKCLLWCHDRCSDYGGQGFFACDFCRK